MAKLKNNAKKQQKVTIYTGGACSGNPGPGGYGVVILCVDERQELSGGFRLTTNSRMEMLAIIEALRTIPSGSSAALYSDSKFIVDSFNLGWLKKWRENGWRRSGNNKVLNIDLWMQILDLWSRHDVQFVWIKGHDGNLENERCDALAVQAAASRNLARDEKYEQQCKVVGSSHPLCFRPRHENGIRNVGVTQNAIQK